MSKVLGKIAIISEQDQALGVDIQATHMKKSLGPIKDEVTHTWPATLVTHCRHHADGLIDREHQRLFGGWHSGAIDVDRVSIGVDPHALLADCLAVDAYPTLFDELLTSTTTAYTCLSEHLLQADSCLRLTRHD
jgi:hypothetical protein